jgi:hypothetical protein
MTTMGNYQYAAWDVEKSYRDSNLPAVFKRQLTVDGIRKRLKLLLIALLPTFIQAWIPSSRVKWPQERTLRKTAFLDGLRGWYRYSPLERVS